MNKLSELERHIEELKGSGFLGSIKIMILPVFLAIIAQNIYQWSNRLGYGNWTWILACFILIMALVLLFGKSMYKSIHTPYSAITALLMIALATAFGTFISQGMTSDLFTSRYGAGFSEVLRFFMLDDVFHSWWYVVLFILLSISLTKISLRRKLNWGNLGFHLAHLGPIIILLGFWWDFFAGFRGIIHLETGRSTNVIQKYQPNTNRYGDTLVMDFKLKLDKFEFENFDPEHRIQIVKSEKVKNTNPETADSLPYISRGRIVTTVAPEIGKSRGIYGTDIEFEVKEFYPNFYMQYAYPPEKDSVPPNNPGIMIELINPHGKDLLQLRNTPGKNITNDPIIGASYEFYWELPSDLEEELNNFENGISWANRHRIIFVGKDSKYYEAHRGSLLVKNIVPNEYIEITGTKATGLSVLFIFPDAAYLQTTPSTIDENEVNPVARLEVTRESWEKPISVFLFPQATRPGGQFPIKDSDYYLALESIKDREMKYWRSDLSVIGFDESVKKQQSIVVNEPMYYKGYRFYQTDYDPNNPKYSGIGVSHVPGLYVIYFGFYILTAGVLIMFYMRFTRKVINRKKLKQLQNNA